MTLNEILRSPQVVEKLAKQGLITTGGSAASFGTFLKNERDKWEKVVNDTGIPKVEGMRSGGIATCPPT